MLAMPLDRVYRRRQAVFERQSYCDTFQLDLAILNAEAAAGMYKKPIDVLAKEFRYDHSPIKSAPSSLLRGHGGIVAKGGY